MSIIIPCIIGGIILLAGLGILIYCIKSKKGKKEELEDISDDNEPIVGSKEYNEDSF